MRSRKNGQPSSQRGCRTLHAGTIVLSLLLPVSFAKAQAPNRVDTAVALAQIVKRVDPAVPPEAAKARIGGAVIADVTVAPNGTVSSVTILDGPTVLRAAAERALLQWTFKPFLLRGKPSAVQVILEVSFPDPAKEEQDRIFEAHRATTYECERQLETDARTAQEVCADAVRKAEALPSDRVLERSHAVGNHARSLMASGQIREAIAQFERVIQIRSARAEGPDADAADVHQILAVLHQQIDENAKADKEFTTAVEMYTAALESLPAMADRYAPRLQLALVRHAALKRLLGDSAASAALDARAARIGAAAKPAPAEPEPRMIRTVNDLQITEPPTAQLTDDDVRQIRSAIAPALRKPWRLDLLVYVAPGRTPDWNVDAFLEPDVASPTFRRGRLAFLTTTPPPGSRETARVWRRVEGAFYYIQVAATVTDAAGAGPIRVQPAPNSPPPSDDDLVSIVRMIGDRAAPKPTGRVLSDIQPWPVTRIVVWDTGELQVELSDPAEARHSQTVRVRQKGRQWTVVEMMELGGRAR